jgi:hypothetical protein
MMAWSPRAGLFTLATTTFWLLAGSFAMATPLQENPEPKEEAPVQPPYEKEIHQLHDFFQEWFRGELPETDEAFARFEDVMAESMVHINPGGTASEREVLVPAIRGGYGSWKERGEAWKIEIRAVQLRQDRGDTLVVTYEEWQFLGEQPRARLSTVVFGQRDDAPNGLEWLHVHEVWMPRQ